MIAGGPLLSKFWRLHFAQTHFTSIQQAQCYIVLLHSVQLYIQTCNM